MTRREEAGALKFNLVCRSLGQGGILLVIIWLIATSTPMPAWGDENKAPNPSGEIRVVLDDDYPPYSFRDNNGNLQGILIDQWHLWEKTTGTKVALYGMNWDEAQNYFKAGQADVIDTILYSEKRERTYDFSESNTKIDVPIFFSPNITGITDAKSLIGFSVAVKKGDNCVDVLLENGVYNLQQYDSYAAIIRAFKNEQIVAFVMDEPSALYYIYKMGLQGQVRYSPPIYMGEMHRAVLKGHSQLLAQVDEGFARLPSTEYKAIDKRWLGSPLVNTRQLRYMGWAALIGVVSLVVLVLLTKTLQRQVQLKTAETSEMLASLTAS
jgi:ABC-type amino acid transport substrate-binding protein